LDQAPIVQEMPVQSFVCNPTQNTIMGGKNATDITLKGVAWSGGGRKIERVDVSIDGGKTWTAAELYKVRGGVQHIVCRDLYDINTQPCLVPLLIPAVNFPLPIISFTTTLCLAN
jgi:hypothetical protein